MVSRASTPFLTRPKGRGYSFVIAVPQALRGKFKSKSTGKPLRKIVEGLGTDSLREAERKAAKRLAHWKSSFARAAAGEPLSLAEIDDEAREYYRTKLARLAGEADAVMWIGEERQWHEASLKYSNEALKADNFSRVQWFVDALNRREGSNVEQGTTAHTLLCRALIRADIAAIEGHLRALDGKPSDEPASFLGRDAIDPYTLRPTKLQRRVVPSRITHGPWALFEQWLADVKPATSTVNRWRAIFLNLQDKFGQRERFKYPCLSPIGNKYPICGPTPITRDSLAPRNAA
jgi:hypothetical protein